MDRNFPASRRLTRQNLNNLLSFGVTDSIRQKWRKSICDHLKVEYSFYNKKYKDAGSELVQTRYDKEFSDRLDQLKADFDRDVKTIGKHINNALKEELDGLSVIAKFATTASDGKIYQVEHYNIEMITSIGYRVKSKRGVQFRVWANKILKDYLLRGYSVNQRLLQMESRIDRRLLEHDKRLDDLTDKVDFFIRTSLPPKEGVFFNGQIFDAHEFICRLIKSATERIILIDNYVDESVLVQLDNRNPGVSALIYTGEISRTFLQSINRHNRQYAPIEVKTAEKIHDRFLIIDNTLYHIGASIKDLGKKLFAFSRLEISPEYILENL